MKRTAIVRPPPKSFQQCISSHPDVMNVRIERALEQHKAYCEALEDLGCEIIELPALETHPDSCFVEDTAVIEGSKAIITRMARDERRGEEDAVSGVLDDYFNVRRVANPGTLEGGDVIHCEGFLICGESSRSNESGISQMRDWLGCQVHRVINKEIIHLKSHATYLGENTIVIAPALANHPAFDEFTRIVLPIQESYASNTLTINGTVLMSKSYPESMSLVREAGFDIMKLEMSEFEKCEGALTCLSLLF